MWIGVLMTAAFAVWLIVLAGRGDGRRSLPRYGWWGLGAMVVLEALLALGVPVIATFFTALIWPAYIVAADAAVYRLSGRSLLHRPTAFAAMALLSIPAWLIFEVYNFRLRNWVYAGVPQQFWVFALGAGVAFATILPGIFETAELFYAGWTTSLRWRPYAGARASQWSCRRPRVIAGLGLALLLLPLLAPEKWAAYLFALVWVGFIFLLDPLHQGWGWPSLLADLEAGRPGWFIALLLGGAACGFFWEFWNFWAQARWVYIFPIFHRYRIFAMPVPGFVGFPPFAVECFTLYIFLAQALLPPGWRYDFPGAVRAQAALVKGSKMNMLG